LNKIEKINVLQDEFTASQKNMLSGCFFSLFFFLTIVVAAPVGVGSEDQDATFLSPYVPGDSALYLLHSRLNLAQKILWWTHPGA